MSPAFTPRVSIGLPGTNAEKTLGEVLECIPFALIAGLATRGAEYVARVDADDRCLPPRLAIQPDCLGAGPRLGSDGVILYGCSYLRDPLSWWRWGTRCPENPAEATWSERSTGLVVCSLKIMKYRR